MAFETYSFVSTISGAAHTKGAYTVVSASTPFDASEVYYSFNWASNADRFFLTDIATGAASSETVIVANIHGLYRSSSVVGNFMKIDVDIPAGSRLAIRSQCSSATNDSFHTIMLADTPLRGLSNPVTYGATTATSGGLILDPGAVAATKGLYGELSAATSADITDLIVLLSSQTQSETIAAFQWNRVDIATGAALSETVVIPDIGTASSVATDTCVPNAFRYGVSIPAGSRLAARTACSVTTVGDRNLSIVVIGMNVPAAATGGGEIAVPF